MEPGAWSLEQRAWGMEQRAWGMGHGAWGRAEGAVWVLKLDVDFFVFAYKEDTNPKFLPLIHI